MNILCRDLTILSGDKEKKGREKENDQLINGIFDLVIDQSIGVKRFLIRFSFDIIAIDANVGVVNFLQVIYFVLSDPSLNESLILLSIKEFQRYYEKIIMHIANIPIVTQTQSKTSNSSNIKDPRTLWKTVRDVSKIISDWISSPQKSEALRSHCLKFLGTAILFSLPLDKGPNVNRAADPRLARTMKKASEGTAGATGETQSAEKIPLHHPFINRNELQKEAEDLVSKILIWATTGGPQTNQFSASLMALLGETIVNVTTERQSYGSNAAKALTFMIQGPVSKGTGQSVCQLMSEVERGSLAKATHRLLRSASAFASDSEGIMAKLRSALGTLEALGITTAAAPVDATLGKKRDQQALNVEFDENDIDSESKRSAHEALDMAASSFLSSRGAGDKGVAAAQSPHTANAAKKMVIGDCTELCTDLSPLVTSEASLLFSTSSIKLVSIQTSSSSFTAKAISSGEVQLMRYISPDSRMYNDLAVFSLKKMLDSFSEVCQLGLQSFNHRNATAYSVMCVRTVVSHAICDLINQKEVCRVGLVQSLSSSAVGELSLEQLGLPKEITLPLPIWLFLSFIFNQQTAVFKDANEVQKKENAFKINMLVMLSNSIYEQSLQQGDQSISLLNLFESVCITSLSRLVQLLHLRNFSKQYFLNLQKVPLRCIGFLTLLMHTGSKAATTTSYKKEIIKNIGTRLEAMNLLGQLVFSLDESCGSKSLNTLLWYSVSDDFEVRSKVINLIAQDIMNVNGWIDSNVVLFALQAVVNLIGQESLQTWSDATKPMEVKEEDAEVSNEEKMELEELPTSDAVALECNDNEVNEVSSLPSLRDAFLRFDNGLSFGGSFPNKSSGLTEEVIAKRNMHLLSQLCLINIDILRSYMDIYSAATTGSLLSTSLSELMVTVTETAEAKSDVTEPVAAASETVPTTKWNLLKYIHSELSYIIPVVSQKNPPEKIFEVMSKSSTSNARPLLIVVLNVMLQDFTNPPSANLLSSVREFIISASSTFTREEVPSDSILFDQMSDDDFKLFVPLIASIPSAEIEKYLPRIIRIFIESSEADYLKFIFSRITKARPPPLTKVKLLVHLHRIDYESNGLKQKNLLDAISLCLNNRSEFTAEVVKESLKALLADTVPPFALMRTAILSSQTFNEIKRYVLSDVIPYLVSKAVYNTSSDLWKGVIFVAKNFASTGFKNSEFTLRALLGIPGIHMKSLLKAAPNIKASMCSLLQTLSAEERDEVLSGKWIGEGSMHNYKEDTEKLRVIKDIMTATATGAAPASK